MKKLLIFLSSFTLVSGASLSVISCKTAGDKTYNQFREQLNQTKGNYDDLGNPLTKSSASVVYIGARDNASSQSFEASLKNTFGDDIPTALRALSKPGETVKVSEPVLFDAYGAKLDSDTLSITNLKIKGLEADSVYAQVTLGETKFDATIQGQGSGNIILQILDAGYESFEADLKDAFTRASTNPDRNKSTIKTYSLKETNASLENHQGELYNQGVASYESNGLERKNADRGVLDVKMQLRANRNYYGAILDQSLVTPTYGIKSKGNQEIYAPITVGLDYAKPQLNFHAFTFDKVSDYWKGGFFDRFTSYLKEDILYQLGANDAIKRGEDKESEANEKQLPEVKKRVNKANKIVAKIEETKGPMFLFFKNGHIVDVRKGGNRYYEFGGKDNLKEPVYYSDLLSGAKELGSVWSQSAQDHFDSIINDGVKVGNYVIADDGGTANGDPQKGAASDKEKEKDADKDKDKDENKDKDKDNEEKK